MPKSDKEKIWESFEGRKVNILIGFLCFLYFLANYIDPSKQMIANILPPVPSLPFMILILLVFIYQIFTWRMLGFFKGNWYRHWAVFGLLFCEFNLILFVVNFLLWPFYLFYLFLLHLPRV